MGKVSKEVKAPLVSKEIAQAEVEKWLDYKKVDDLQREDNEDHIKSMVSYIMSGNLTLNDDYSFTHKLKFPIGEGEKPITELVYKARLTEREISQHLNGIKSDDGDGRLAAHMSALTGEVKNIIKSQDKEDFKISRSIALFFV